MAIYHCSISNVSRTKGSSSCATLSYISGEPVREERTAQTFSYGRSERVLAVETVLPEYAPEQYKDPAVLFNSIENYEKSENARTAKKVEVALPREFDLKRQKEVVREYIRENLTKEGYCATFAIHNDNNNNPHAHILVANRQLDEKGEWNLKSRKEYALDENGERIPLLDKDGNQKLGKRNEKLWKRVSVQVNLLDKREFLQQLREEWAKECNRYLAQDHQIDHRSYEDQGIERIPTIHEGYAAREIERRGGISERCEENREIAQHNNLIQQIQNALTELQERLRELFGINKEKEKVRSSYETAKYYALQELRRSTFDRVFEPLEIKYEFAERKRELIDEHFKMLNDKIFKGVPLPEKYYEIEKELDSYNRIEGEMKAMVRNITDNMERGITDDEFLMESALKAAKEPKSRTKSRERSREDPDLSR